MSRFVILLVAVIALVACVTYVDAANPPVRACKDAHGKPIVCDTKVAPKTPAAGVKPNPAKPASAPPAKSANQLKMERELRLRDKYLQLAKLRAAKALTGNIRDSWKQTRGAARAMQGAARMDKKATATHLQPVTAGIVKDANKVKSDIVNTGTNAVATGRDVAAAVRNHNAGRDDLAKKNLQAAAARGGRALDSASSIIKDTAHLGGGVINIPSELHGTGAKTRKMADAVAGAGLNLIPGVHAASTVSTVIQGALKTVACRNAIAKKNRAEIVKACAEAAETALGLAFSASGISEAAGKAVEHRLEGANPITQAVAEKGAAWVVDKAGEKGARVTAGSAAIHDANVAAPRTAKPAGAAFIQAEEDISEQEMVNLLEILDEFDYE